MISEKMKSLVEKSSVIRAMFEEGKKMADKYGAENVFDYSLGNPNVEPPIEVKNALIDILNTEQPTLVHGYMNNSGYIDVRTDIANYTNTKYKTNISYENIVMTCGAAGGLNIIFKTLLNPGDEVITFAPYFTEYNNYCNNYDAKLVVVPANTDTFQPNIDLLDNYITPKTKIILINSPNNPTGVIYTKETIEKLCTYLKNKEVELGHDLFLLSDEPYREIVYDNIEVPYILNYYHNSLVGYSYSKSLSLPGERIGYIVTSPHLSDIDTVMNALNVANRVSGFVNAPSLFQRVIAKTLGVEVDINIYKKNRDLLYNHLLSVGYEAVHPDGAFYLFVKTPIENDIKFANDAKKYNLLVVPGSSFGCSGYIRLSYCTSYKTIKNSLDAFTKLINNY